MFLNRLNEEEKKFFLMLAHYVARCDGDFGEEEKIIIQQYCNEMQIDDIEFNEKEFNLENLLKKMKNSYSQKIILLELMALIYADNFLHEKEKEVIEKMCEIFNIDENLAKTYAQWTKTVMDLYLQGEYLLKI